MSYLFQKKNKKLIAILIFKNKNLKESVKILEYLCNQYKEQYGFMNMTFGESIIDKLLNDIMRTKKVNSSTKNLMLS